MKTTTISLAALLCACFSNAANNDLKKNILPTPYGSFGSMKAEGQGESDVADMAGSKSSMPQEYKHSSIKTSDGGTASFVKFNTKPSENVVKRKANIIASEKVIIEEIPMVSVYPNPNNGDMTIGYSIPKNEQAVFTIFDLSGKKITSHLLTGESNQIVISEKNLYAGIYFYNVISNGKIVKQDKIVVIK